MAPSVASANQKTACKWQLKNLLYKTWNIFDFWRAWEHLSLVHVEFISIAIKRFISRKAAVSKINIFHFWPFSLKKTDLADRKMGGHFA